MSTIPVTPAADAVEFHVAESNSESDQPLNSAKRAVSCMG